MTDPNEGSRSREDIEHGFFARLRGMLASRNDTETLRDTIEELIELEEDGEGADNAEELSLLRNVLSVRDVAVEDVMVPRVDICGVEAETTIADVAKIMSESGHSRLPVYKGQLDEVIGMVHIKDLLACWDDDQGTGITKIVRKPLFVAPSMPALELLLQMRVQRLHMALVVDEFGGVDGLVTIEDLVEEIIGEIEDEHDQDAGPRLERNGPDQINIDARLRIEDFELETGKFLAEEDRDEDIDTMGGLVFYLAGRVPGRGEIIRYASGVEFEILEADPRRIRRLRVSKISVPNDE
ncbi:MAG: Hemolysin C [Alphaproteobacteria bacterium MarineAlpha11_Bin1]|nr:MAG: Hemolysin C [Alphaproteobacteria bacterium MarineAlpha11_Bin1]|tara:strand:- start:8995 stop:9882 length:888 start_codon:yes stop_codon:yes gene_type:complete